MKRMSWLDLVQGAPPGGRILLVDDDPEVRKSVSRLLSRSGYTAQSCASAEEADLLLRDPEMAVIMLTGLDAPEVAVGCMDHGARTFLVKPVEAPFLVRAVRDAIAVRHLLAEHNRSAEPAASAGRTAWRASS